MKNIEWNQNWDKILSLYKRYRELRLFSEETIVDLDIHVPTLIEVRDALDHIMRYFDRDENTNEEENLELNKAILHIERAILDTLDYLVIKNREKVADLLGKYPSSTIQRVLPDYYENIRENLMSLPQRIEDLRKRNDCASSEYINDLNQTVSKLYDVDVFLRKAITSLSSIDDMIDYMSNKRKKVASSVFLSILSALIGALISWLLINL